MSASSKQEQLAAQIAALQAQLNEEKAKESRKRKATEHIRVAASPSPTKKRQRLLNAGRAAAPHAAPRIAPPSFTGTRLSTQSAVPRPGPSELEPSRLASALTSYSVTAPDSDDESTGPKQSKRRESGFGADRNDDLTLVENLEPSPLEHTPPKDDPLFKTIEPYSKINLRSRSLDHDDLQEFLRGRYYISPSRLYSVARLTQNRQGYEVPVDGYWATIAVIAERGTISVSRGTKVESDHESDEEPINAEPSKPKDGAKKGKQPQKKKSIPEKKARGKKYLTLKLVDFGRRSTDPHTGKVTIGGDALVNLILFEADKYDTLNTPDGAHDRVYRGGSGGAFEQSASLRAGAVIAIMNPKILKPFQRGSDKPHPTDNVLALTPSDAESIKIIGLAKDLGKCPALKRDGTPCGSWCDKRVSEVCDFHVQRAVQSRRAARPEFATATSSMSTTAKGSSSRDAYDPSRKWGLLPAAGMAPGATKASHALGGGTTYVMPGLILSSERDKAVADVMGREKHEKKRRIAEKAAQEKELEKLIERDGKESTAARSILMARQAIAAKQQQNQGGASKGKGKAKAVVPSSSDILATAMEATSGAKASQRVFSASAIQRIGFDPTSRSGFGKRRPDDTKASQVLQKLTTEKTSFKLGHMPGPRIRSGVFAPTEPKRDEEEEVSRGADRTVVKAIAEDSDDELWVV